ncbi:hypothetical protein IWW38_003728 [Coemansia aciculifera]|uniref:Uncharacterized protein n=1 Tax=Coemansia aciculifera TaxID=417176 RepID=A0ACC1LZU2_9FUNG|nr:hypothetical protein IWW38_003728 [Coemansia aciculifera]
MAEGGTAEVLQVTFSEVVSTAKERALKRQVRRRAVWLSVELLFFVALLALLVLHSFRLSNNKGDNKYTQWSSSWVMILLSVLLVLVALSVFVTYYYYRTVLTWIRRPETTDADLQGARGRGAHRVGWKFLRPQHSARPAVEPTPRRHLATSYSRQAPWVSPHGRNSRARRQMRAHQQRRQSRRAARSSSLSSTSITASSYSHHARAPRRPPTVL